MPKAKKKTKRKTSRRGKVGGINAKSMIIPLLSGVVGFASGKKVDDFINDKILKGKTVNGKIVGGVEVGVGAGLMFVKFGKMPKMAQIAQKAAGGFIAGVGLRKLAEEMGIMNGVIQGYKDSPVLANVIQRRRRNGVSGYGKVSVLAGQSGYTPTESMNGNNKPFGYNVGNALGMRAMRRAV